MLNRFFAPYAEYTLRTKISETEMRAALQRECKRTFFKSLRPVWFSDSKVEELRFYMRRRKLEFVLMPILRGRNSARGIVHLTLENDRDSAGTILHVVIRPSDCRWFCLLWLGFLAFWTVGSICCRQWMHLIVAPVMLGGFLGVLCLCRSTAMPEIPKVQLALELLIRRLEAEIAKGPTAN